jgi:hypothetical protein
MLTGKIKLNEIEGIPVLEEDSRDGISLLKLSLIKSMSEMSRKKGPLRILG